MNPTTKGRLMGFAYLAVFLICIALFEWIGAIGFLLLILCMLGFKFFWFRKNFMMALRTAEMSIFKKPLDKEHWRKGEMKNTKIVLTKKGKPITNSIMASLFFALFVVFFLIFAWNRFTMNIIMAIVMLQFSLAFKTWDIIRETQNDK